MAADFSSVVNSVVDALSPGECKVLMFLTSDLLAGQRVEDVRAALVTIATCTTRSRPASVIIMELLFLMRRFDILQRIMGKNRKQVEKELSSGGVISPYRVLMMELSESLGTDELQSLVFMLHDKIPKSRAQQINNFLEVVCVLEQLSEVSSSKLELIEQCVRNIRRNDLIKKIQSYNRVRETERLPVCETGLQHAEVPVNQYNMNYELRGVCVIIDCIGGDGERLKHTFERLGFVVFPYTLLGVGEMCEVLSILHSISQNSILQRAAVFTCCLLDVDTRTLNAHTRCSHAQLMEVYGQCVMLRDKPKLFFTQRLLSDQDLQTDALPFSTPTPHTHAQPNPTEDVLWCTCETGDRDVWGQGSVYLQVLRSALLQAHDRRLHVLDALAEANRQILEHNQRNPDKTYHVTLTHTLRKSLYL